MERHAMNGPNLSRMDNPIYAAAVVYAAGQAQQRYEARLAGVRWEEPVPVDPVYEAAVVVAVQKALLRREANRGK